MKEIDINKIVEILNESIESLNITAENLIDYWTNLLIESVVFFK